LLLRHNLPLATFAHSEERTEKIIGWSLFDRDPLKSFDFGNVTLLGDAAHPLLPYGSQGATQAPWTKLCFFCLKCHVKIILLSKPLLIAWHEDVD